MKSPGFVLLFLFAATCQAIAASGPFARIVVRTEQPVLAGQQVQVDVQVFAPNFFMSAPQFPLFDLPGAIVTMPDDRGINLVEKVDGQDFAGIQKSYVITPLAAGQLTFPPVEIEFKYAAEPGKPSDGKVTLPQETIVVNLPAGANGANGPVPLARISITQSLDRDLEGMKTGDALVRTVDIRAEGMPAMMIPPPALEAPAGVRIYRKDPLLSDGSPDGRGFKEGERIDTVTYVFEMPGDYVLPAVAIDWFDTAANKTGTARTDEVKLSVTQAPATQPVIAPQPPPTQEPAPLSTMQWKWLVALAVALVLGGAIFTIQRRLAPRLRDRAARRRQARENSEAAAFEQVQRALAARDRMATYRDLDQWTRRLGFPSVAGWAAAVGDGELQADLGRLEKGIFGPAPDTAAWNDAGRLLSRLSASRKSWLKEQQRPTSAPTALPPLNPPMTGRLPRDRMGTAP